MTGRFVIAMAIGAAVMFVAIESHAKCCKFEGAVPAERMNPGLLQTPRK